MGVVLLGREGARGKEPRREKLAWKACGCGHECGAFACFSFPSLPRLPNCSSPHASLRDVEINIVTDQGQTLSPSWRNTRVRGARTKIGKCVWSRYAMGTRVRLELKHHTQQSSRRVDPEDCICRRRWVQRREYRASQNVCFRVFYRDTTENLIYNMDWLSHHPLEYKTEKTEYGLTLELPIYNE